MWRVGKTQDTHQCTWFQSERRKESFRMSTLPDYLMIINAPNIRIAIAGTCISSMTSIKSFRMHK